jgi:hypothetical protein
LSNWRGSDLGRPVREEAGSASKGETRDQSSSESGIASTLLILYLLGSSKSVAES